MNCDQARGFLDAYMDGELSSVDRKFVEEHLNTCMGCRQFLKERKVLSLAIKQAATYVPVPPTLGAQFRRRTGPSRRVGIPSIGLAFAVGIAATLLIWRPWSSSTDRIIHDVVTDHSRSIMGPHQVDFESSDADKLANWFSGKGLTYAPNVANGSKLGFNLTGGRFDLVDGRRVATVVYNRLSHVIEVFEMPSDTADPISVDLKGFHVKSWTDCGIAYWEVSDVAPADLDTLKLAFLNTPVRASP